MSASLPPRPLTLANLTRGDSLLSASEAAYGEGITSRASCRVCRLVRGSPSLLPPEFKLAQHQPAPCAFQGSWIYRSTRRRRFVGALPPSRRDHGGDGAAARSPGNSRWPTTRLPDRFDVSSPTVRAITGVPGVRERVLTEGSSSLFFLPLSQSERTSQSGSWLPGRSPPEFRDGWPELTDLGPCFWHRRRLVMTMVESLGGGSLVRKGAVR